VQIKAADDKQPQLDALAALLDRPDVDAATRRRIEQEIRQVRAGAAGERDAAYQIEFHSGAHAGRATIHDLRLEVGGRVSQIDHLFINRLLDIWVLESKHFAEGVSINDHGEWTGFSGGRPYGMASPIEQNRRHVAVLEQAFATRLVALPKRLGMVAIKPRIRSLVLVSNGARISRPKTKAAQALVEGLETVIKVEQWAATINRDLNTRTPAAIAKRVSEETVQRIGRNLAAMHRPITVDWAARFGLPAVSAVPAQTESPAPVPPPDALLAAAGEATCAACGRPVSQAVIDYCLAKTERFGGRILCYWCQRRTGRSA
jgi:Nuclease-related domain